MASSTPRPARAGMLGTCCRQGDSRSPGTWSPYALAQSSLPLTGTGQRCQDSDATGEEGSPGVHVRLGEAKEDGSEWKSRSLQAPEAGERPEAGASRKRLHLMYDPIPHPPMEKEPLARGRHPGPEAELGPGPRSCRPDSLQPSPACVPREPRVLAPSPAAGMAASNLLPGAGGACGGVELGARPQLPGLALPGPREGKVSATLGFMGIHRRGLGFGDAST